MKWRRADSWCSADMRGWNPAWQGALRLKLADYAPIEDCIQAAEGLSNSIGVKCLGQMPDELETKEPLQCWLGWLQTHQL